MVYACAGETSPEFPWVMVGTAFAPEGNKRGFRPVSSCTTVIGNERVA